jgi:hypothetical protein
MAATRRGVLTNTLEAKDKGSFRNRKPPLDSVATLVFGQQLVISEFRAAGGNVGGQDVAPGAFEFFFDSCLVALQLYLQAVAHFFGHGSFGGSSGLAVADRLTNPATYGCSKDEGEYAAERLLNGVRVGEKNLLEHLRPA